MKNPKHKARKLVKKLEREATPDNFYENYGQKEIREFKDKLQKENPELPYSEMAKISDILNRVSEITPY